MFTSMVSGGAAPDLVDFWWLKPQASTAATLEENCADLENYHPCLCQELAGGGLTSARAMGWLRGPSAEWRFHAVVQNVATCELADATAGDAPRPGFCCLD